jgi:hypothetical protein
MRVVANTRLLPFLAIHSDSVRWVFIVFTFVVVGTLSWNFGQWDIQSEQCQLILSMLAALSVGFISYRFVRPVGTQDLKALVAVIALSVNYSHTLLLLSVVVLVMRWNFSSRLLAQVFLMPMFAMLLTACLTKNTNGTIFPVSDYGVFKRADHTLVKKVDELHSIYMRSRATSASKRIYRLVREIEVAPGLNLVKLLESKTDMPEQITVGNLRDGAFTMNGGRRTIRYIDE